MQGLALCAGTAGAGQSADDATSIRFEDVREAMGVDWAHFAGRSAAKEMPETMGGGIAWLDYDNDGRYDLYFVDSGTLAGTTPLTEAPARAGENRLFRNAPSGRFEDASQAGAGDPGYGMGVAVGDYDSDGWSDLFVTNYGANALYRNNGDGTFGDVTAETGLAGDSWSTSAAWGDLDADGFAELYVANYVSYEVPSVNKCTDVNDRLIYCTPDLFDGVVDELYQNLGGRAFENVTEAAGTDNAADGKGLGVVIVDIDADARPDIYVANDATRNFFYVNRGELRFEDQGVISGTAVSAEGYPQSGMGVDIADIDGDGSVEIGVTNFERQAVNLYMAMVPGLFQDQTFAVGLGEPTVGTLGFGLAFVDADGDGDLDVVIANGHLDYDETSPQANQVFRNLAAERRAAGGLDGTSGLLRELPAGAGDPMQARRVSRGLAAGDLEGDGWPDLVITNVQERPTILRNTAPRADSRLVLRLRGRQANRDGYGAHVEVTPLVHDGTTAVQYHDVKSSTSYLSQGSNELYLGIGQADRARVVVRWPDGTTEDLGELEAGWLILVREGMGVVARRPLEDSA